MVTYNIRIYLEWDEPSQTYSVTSPDVPEVFTFGKDMAEVQKNVQEAVTVLLEDIIEHGDEIPAIFLQQPPPAPQVINTLVTIPALA